MPSHYGKKSLSPCHTTGAEGSPSTPVPADLMDKPAKKYAHSGGPESPTGGLRDMSDIPSVENAMSKAKRFGAVVKR